MLDCKPNNHCLGCSHAIYIGKVDLKGKVWTFEFRPMFGVFFTRKDGEIRSKQPNELHPIWQKWNIWFNEFQLKEDKSD